MMGHREALKSGGLARFHWLLKFEARQRDQSLAL